MIMAPTFVCIQYKLQVLNDIASLTRHELLVIMFEQLVLCSLVGTIGINSGEQ